MSTTATALPELKFRPLYDASKSYLDNLMDGPQFDGFYPEREHPREKIDFLGYSISSPLGVPSGPLLNSSWVKCAADLGFDVLAYKTIRNKKWLGHPLPNVLFVDVGEDILGDSPAITKNVDELDVAELGITNSFGNPSMNPEYLQVDIEKSRQSLHEGQVLIVSVFGIGKEDFVRSAILAKDAGAHIIEANFSCPNVSSAEGSCLYADFEEATDIAAAIVKAIHPLPLILKVGYSKDMNYFRKLLVRLKQVGVAGICGINTIAKEVVTPDGINALGPQRKVSGICGSPIRPYAVEFTKGIKNIIEEEKLDLALLSCGGVTLSEHFDALLTAGADVAMAASGMMWDPYLAMRWHKRSQS